MSDLPPSGYPPGYRPPPPKYRPSAAWFVLGIGLILAAVAIAVGMFVWLLSGFLETDATLTTNGQPNRVTVGTVGDRMLWLEDPDTRCTVFDREADELIELHPVDGLFHRSDSHGDLDGLYRFAPGSGDLQVSCATAPFAESGTDKTVLIGPMPRVGSFVVGILVAIVVPGLLGLAGLVVLLVTGILWSLRQPRPTT